MNPDISCLEGQKYDFRFEEGESRCTKRVLPYGREPQQEFSSLLHQAERAFLAEAVRFELTDGCPSPVFKTGALNHSATLPRPAL
jgi:hypothetical protein